MTSPDGDTPVAIVTGGGSGIGRATALLLAREGYTLVLVGRTREKLDETARRIVAEGRGGEPPLVLPADLARSGEAFGVIDEVLHRQRRLDALVNNAGWGWLRPISETDLALLEATFAINFFSAANLILRAWPAFLRQRAACVVNVSSGAAHDPFPGFFAYAASKAAMESLGRSIAAEAAELGLSGIRAYSVAPGAVETPLLRSVFAESVVPRAKTMRPLDIAGPIRDCVLGKAPVPNGGTVLIRGPA
ncbi:MAG TPA: SDR family oxidoreductase [Planctomycetota bacterium]|nr:SDR family oxidoreductase [Planctomycetota bacterium]